MDRSQASDFLVNHKRDYWCTGMQKNLEEKRENNSGKVTIHSTINLNEECCNEGCDTEEMDEKMHPIGYSNPTEVSMVVRTNSYIMSSIGVPLYGITESLLFSA